MRIQFKNRYENILHKMAKIPKLLWQKLKEISLGVFIFLHIAHLPTLRILVTYIRYVYTASVQK